MNELVGLGLLYLIGASGPVEGKDGAAVEVPYDQGLPRRGVGIAYGNLLVEPGSGEFPPYRKPTDTAAQYGEKVPDETGPGFEQNLRAQFYRRKEQGFKYIELDNPDAYPLEAVMRATALAESYGLGVIAKNAKLVDGGAQWLRHPNVVGVIVEKGAGSPADYAALRPSADFPVWFVSFGSGRAWASITAADITARGYTNMSVTWSPGGEYTRSVDVLLPLKKSSQTQSPDMAEPAHLALARSLIGKYTDGPDVPKLAMEIAAAFPEMTSYCRLANVATSWCGILIGVLLLRSYGIRPPFGDGDLLRFMWVDAWEDEDWGGQSIPISQARPGDIIIMRSPHHISVLDEVDGDTFWCIGGNQSNGLTRAPFQRSGVRSVRRSPTVIARPMRPAVSNFDKCLPLLLEHEGGYSNHPSDPGGPTNFGITIIDYRLYIDPNGTAADVRGMTVDQAKTIYRSKYWDAMRCDDLPSGVDYAVFDYGVNSGISRSAKVLQRLVIPHEVDGEIGPNTIAATSGVSDPRTLINQICDERLAFLQGLSTWPTFGNGWGRRVREVRAAALEMAATPKEPTMPKAPEIFPPGTPLPGQQVDWALLIQQLLPPLIAAIQQARGGQPLLPPPVVEPPPPAPAPPPPASQRPSVQLGVLGLVASAVLQAFGFIGTPLGMGVEPTTLGTAATVIPAAIAATGLTGVWGIVANVGLSLLGTLLKNRIPK
jgi:lysozyme family protein